MCWLQAALISEEVAARGTPLVEITKQVRQALHPLTRPSTRPAQPPSCYVRRLGRCSRSHEAALHTDLPLRGECLN